jgi:hypothetical protein
VPVWVPSPRIGKTDRWLRCVQTGQCVSVLFLPPPRGEGRVRHEHSDVEAQDFIAHLLFKSGFVAW